MTPDDKIISKIKKLLTLADPSRGGTSEEVSTAMAMANKLMAEHNLTMSQVTLTEDQVQVKRAGVQLRARPYYWEKRLAGVFADLCETRVLYQSAKDLVIMIFIGEEHDVVIAQEMYRIFLKQIDAAARKAFKSFKDQRSFCVGYCTILAHRVHQLKAERNSKATSQSQALVYVGRKEAAITKYISMLNTAETHRKTTAARVDSYAATVGARAGMTADLGTERRLA
jgi:hypothetical protein